MSRLLAFFVVAALSATTAAADTAPVINLINSKGEDAATILNEGKTFDTTLNGHSMSMDLVSVPPVYGLNENDDDNYNKVPGNNPSYLSGFVGNPTNGTGSGDTGNMNFLLTNDGGGTNLVIDFKNNPIGPSDVILFGDIDYKEKVYVQAFDASGKLLSLTGWTSQDLTGSTGDTPNSNWAAWNPTGRDANTGTWTSPDSGGLSDPLGALIPNESVSKLEFWVGGNAKGAVDFQVISVPEPSSAVLTLTAVGVLLSCWGLRRRASARRAGSRS